MSAAAEMDVSPDAVAQLLEATRRFRTVSVSAAAQVGADLTRRLRALEVKRDEAASEVRRWQDRLFDCDSDDRAGVERRVADAEESLRTIDRWMRRIEDAASPFRRAADEARVAVSDRLPVAISFLEETLALLAEYHRVALPGRMDAGSSKPGVEGHSAPSAAPGIDPLEIASLAAIPLPAGLHWVRLADISRKDELRPDEKFGKVPADEMRRGFALLRDEILPVLRSGTASPADYFREADRAGGLDYASGAQRVYEAFFGLDRIAVTRKEYGDEFGVSSGRHRILIARELGWAAIPARIL